MHWVLCLTEGCGILVSSNAGVTLSILHHLAGPQPALLLMTTPARRGCCYILHCPRKRFNRSATAAQGIQLCKLHCVMLQHLVVGALSWRMKDVAIIPAWRDELHVCSQESSWCMVACSYFSLLQSAAMCGSMDGVVGDEALQPPSFCWGACCR